MDLVKIRTMRDLAWPAQAVKFAAVGVANTGVDLVVYLVLTRWVAAFAMRPVLAKAVSYSAGTLNSFYWNRRWTFRSNVDVKRALPTYVLAALVGLAINTEALHLSLSAWHLPEWIALAVATGASLGWNFILSKFLVFREARAK